jgi:hypothetical protein
VAFESRLNHGTDPQFWQAYSLVEPSCLAPSTYNTGGPPAKMGGRPSPCIMAGTAQDMLVRVSVLIRLRQESEVAASALTLHCAMAPQKVRDMAATRGIPFPEVDIRRLAWPMPPVVTVMTLN